MSDNTELYQKRGFMSRVGFGEKPALLVVDFIKGFTDLNSPLASNLDAEIAATRQLLEQARAKGLPVHFTTTGYAEAWMIGSTLCTVKFRVRTSLAYSTRIFN